MPPHHQRHHTLSQGLDKEVYQIVRKIIDERSQYGDPSTSRVSFANVYDTIKGSNSSLNRRPKKLLEDSIGRVLETIQQDTEAESDDFDASLAQAVPQQQQQIPASNGLNKSIVKAWARREGGQDTMRSEPSASASAASRRLPNGEPSQKRRKHTTPSIDTSPPTHVSLNSMGGVDAVIKQLKKLLVIPLIHPQMYMSSKAQPPRGVLIHGPPGCGKTMIAHAFAATLGVNFISISAPSIVSGMSGESEKALRDHFEEAKKAAPCLLFIDEIDVITPKRDSTERQMEKRIVAQLMTLMDDLDLQLTDGKPVIVLAATNHPDSLDPALRRGGRFNNEINMGVPNEIMREEILRALTQEANLAGDVDLSLLAKNTPGYVGADLNDLVSVASTTAMERCFDVLQAKSEPSSMDLDVPPEDFTAPASSEVASLYQLVKYMRENPPEPGSSMTITSHDFMTALAQVQPSALREGFATIPSTTFDSIGALKSHIKELERAIINPILKPKVYSELGITPSSGVLLWGPPGCGKTLLAKACANASHANFISVKGPELLNKYVGESERAVRQVFNRARSSVPVIIFFDELDALVPRRDGGTSEASARVVNTMLSELDGFGHSRDGIFVIGATNRPDMIDPAMLRPGRMDTKLFIRLPDAEERVDILRTLCKNMDSQLVFDESLAAIARSSEGYSGADLESLLRRAGYAAIDRLEHSISVDSVAAKICAADFEAARNEVTRSVSVEDEKRYSRLEEKWGKN
ncbi:hypothetical protein A1O3_05887 [Capronia epimyces CBS 606.96]|uniref:AAA+ ATPase domain-containing protein n=1 Tax=Capronia epimyces CBS 606.96 TaxID=1182542 RepID=W9XXA7_9EURO|nr:uncharacterized protein A1O3_05887 [Capronia epimyces CBS 606.96]EXJ85212.1 hypothetical protein A1O3_05887 [Capronia epimyces CBS 606.96]